MLKKLLLILSIVYIITIFIGCQEKREVTVTSKPFTESYIFAEMLSIIVEENTDIKVKRKFGLAGGTGSTHPAMVKGDVDIVAEYTGTAWLYVLKETEMIRDPDVLFQKVKDGFLKEYNMKWFDLYGFNNTYAIGVRREDAEKYNLKTISDLAAVSEEFVYGAEYDFYERVDGFPNLSKTYGLNFKETKDIDIGLKFVAIADGKVNAINAYSTDGLLKKHDIVILEDDKSFFPLYHGATLIKMETLEKYPELEAEFNKLVGIFNEDIVIGLNYQVEGEGKDPYNVAKEFLLEKGIIKEKK